MLIGELIGFPWSVVVVVRLPSVCSQFQTSSPLKPICQSKPNFMWNFLWEGVTKVDKNGPGHMTKMAARPIYGKNLTKSSPEPEVL